MNVFVTGGSGFLGQQLIAALVGRGDVVKALARSVTAAETVRSAGAMPVIGELHDQAALAKGMEGCEVCFHAAAHVKDWGPWEEFKRVSVEGTESVMRAARSAGVRRVVHVGSEAALVDGTPLHDVDETRPLPSTHVGFYPRSKALSEKAALAGAKDGLEVVVVRPRFIWGKGDTVLLPQIIEKVKDGSFRWIGGGHYLTSTCHVRNVVEGLLLAAEKGPSGEVYFVTDGAPVEFRAFLSSLLEAKGVKPPKGEVPTWVARCLAGAGEVFVRVTGSKSPPPLTRSGFHLIGEEVTVNDAKARRALGYVGRVTREEGVAELGEGEGKV